MRLSSSRFANHKHHAFGENHVLGKEVYMPNVYYWQGF